MATTIDRTDVTVDDDSGTPGAPVGDGTTANNVWVQGFLDAIDDLFVGNLTIGGVFTAASLALSGGLSAASLTLSGALSAASGAFSGAVTVGSTLSVTGSATFTAVAAFTNGLKERGRSVALGEEMPVTYQGVNFNANAGLFNVLVGNVAANHYTLIGKQMFWAVQIGAATLTGSPTQLLLTIPDGYSVAQSTTARASYASVNSVAVDDVLVSAAGTTVTAARSGGGVFAANTGATYIYFSIRIVIA